MNNHINLDTVLNACLDHPGVDTICQAEDYLVSLEALAYTANDDDTERSTSVQETSTGRCRLDNRRTLLTPLGRLLASFPSDPRTSKLLFLGRLLKCVFAASIIGAYL